MPLYEYVCPECQQRFERLVRGSETNPALVCPVCGGLRAERVFSTFATGGQRSTTTPTSPACGPVG